MNRMINSNKNWEYSKILTKIDIFGNFDQMRDLRFFFFTKIEIFKNFERSQDFSKFQKESRFYENFEQNCNFAKILLESKFLNIFFYKNQNFL